MSRTTKMSRKDIRWQLLVTVSATALLVSAYGASKARAADGDRPLLWIELGGQLEDINTPQEAFSPPFMASITQANLLSALNVQQPPAYALGEEGKISFQPENSDWIFSAAIRYGRSQRNTHDHQQTKNAKIPFNFLGIFGSTKYGSFYPSSHVKFADGRSQQSEKHTILDFQAGKDVGLGLFGREASSVISAGVRFAQLTSKAQINLSVEPDVNYQPAAPITSLAGYAQFKYEGGPFGGAPIIFHNDDGRVNIKRNFRGVGPSLSWDASILFAGETSSTELSLDWGLNAAILFGRQKTRAQHQTTVKTYAKTRWNIANYAAGAYGHRGFFGPQAPAAVKTNAPPSSIRMRSVTVPNLGGFAGISLKWPNAKLSIGYRADFFFNAMDGGIDTRKSENRAFYGPYASISIGLGD